MFKRVIAILALCLVVGGAWGVVTYAENEDNGTESEVALDQTPDAVRGVLEKFAEAGSVDKIVREDEDGSIAYSSEITIGGTMFELKLNEDGRVLEVESGDDDEQGDDSNEE
ncbi:MAG: hypothetical protein ABI743_08355 [bacterium]